MTVMKDLTHRYSRRRFACLFLSLLVTMVAAPVLGVLGISIELMEVFLLINILAAVLITMHDLRSYLGMGLLVLLLAARAGNALLGYGPLLQTSHGAGALACLLSVYVMFRYTLSEGRVTSERIFAALNVYLLFGVTCGLLFCIFENLWPGSFAIQGLFLDGSRKIQLAHALYFSFVTLGTVGYGDMIPLSGPARALAITEAITGQMYLVVVVARLVSLYHGSGGSDVHRCGDDCGGIDEDFEASRKL